jgi:hypothetical protein
MIVCNISSLFSSFFFFMLNVFKTSGEKDSKRLSSIFSFSPAGFAHFLNFSSCSSNNSASASMIFACFAFSLKL